MILSGTQSGTYYFAFTVFIVKVTLLVHWVCCNKIPQTGKLTNNRNVFLSALEDDFKIRVAAWSGEGPLLGFKLLDVSLDGGKGQGSTLGC